MPTGREQKIGFSVLPVAILDLLCSFLLLWSNWPTSDGRLGRSDWLRLPSVASGSSIQSDYSRTSGRRALYVSVCWSLPAARRHWTEKQLRGKRECVCDVSRPVTVNGGRPSFQSLTFTWSELSLKMLGHLWSWDFHLWGNFYPFVLVSVNPKGDKGVECALTFAVMWPEHTFQVFSALRLNYKQAAFTFGVSQCLYRLFCCFSCRWRHSRNI